MTATTSYSREVFVHASDAMLVIDPYKDRLLMANIAACRLLGYAEQELLDKRASSLCGRLIPALVVFTQEVCEKGTGWRDDIPLQNKQGQRLEVEIAAAAFSEAGQTLLIFTVRDVEKIRRWREFNEANGFHPAFRAAGRAAASGRTVTQERGGAVRYSVDHHRHGTRTPRLGKYHRCFTHHSGKDLRSRRRFGIVGGQTHYARFAHQTAGHQQDRVVAQ